jgi:hypothetical protein
MNASATIRASYIRQARMSFAAPPPRPLSIPQTIRDLEPRPASHEKLKDFKQINHIEYREKCNTERTAPHICVDDEKNADTHEIFIDNSHLESQSYFEWPEIHVSFTTRLKKMLTIFPVRDPIYLVAIIFLLGSIDLVINAFFDLLPRTNPSTFFETEETVAVPTTVLIGSILFFAAGILDTFGALNADAGTMKDDGVFRPALLGSAEFKWIPSRIKVVELAMNNLAFQAGLLVLFGGVIFMFAGIVDFPGVVREENNPLFGLVVFGPQVIHGMLFFVANGMLALSEQEKWYKLKIRDADWQSAFLNAVGGFGFMMAGFFLFQKEELKAAIAAMVGSWAFLTGSLIRWWVVMEVW